MYTYRLGLGIGIQFRDRFAVSENQAGSQDKIASPAPILLPLKRL
jgi:hypothetical protein